MSMTKTTAARTAALLWLLAGIAFVVAGILSDRRQPAFFGVAVAFFAVSVVFVRRGRAGGG